MMNRIKTTIATAHTRLITAREGWSIWLAQYFAVWRDTATGAFHAAYIKVPGMPLSAVIERNRAFSGWSFEKEQGCLKAWAMTVEFTVCFERAPYQTSLEA